MGGDACVDVLLFVVSLPMVKCSAHTYPPFAYMLPESSKRWYGYNNAAFEQQSRGQRHFTTPSGPLQKFEYSVV